MSRIVNEIVSNEAFREEENHALRERWKAKVSPVHLNFMEEEKWGLILIHERM